MARVVRQIGEFNKKIQWKGCSCGTNSLHLELITVKLGYFWVMMLLCKVVICQVRFMLLEVLESFFSQITPNSINWKKKQLQITTLSMDQYLSHSFEQLSRYLIFISAVPLLYLKKITAVLLHYKL